LFGGGLIQNGGTGVGHPAARGGVEVWARREDMCATAGGRVVASLLPIPSTFNSRLISSHFQNSFRWLSSHMAPPERPLMI
jgi:hypothetical protein